MTNYLLDTPEIIATGFLVIGISIAIFSQSNTIGYATVILMGLLFGRIWFRFKTGTRTPIFVSILTFFLGYMIGNAFEQFRITIILLTLGTVAGYYLHEKGIIKSVEY